MKSSDLEINGNFPIDFGENRVAPRAQPPHFSLFLFLIQLLPSPVLQLHNKYLKAVSLQLKGREDVYHRNTTTTVRVITDWEEPYFNTDANVGFSVYFKETAIS